MTGPVLDLAARRSGSTAGGDAPQVRSYDKLYVGGRWVAPISDELIEVVSPHTEQVVATTPAAGTADVDRAVAAARQAFDSGEWRRAPLSTRLAALQRLHDELSASRDEMADLLTAEMGAPVMLTRGLCLDEPLASLRSTIELAAATPWEEPMAGATGDVLVRRQPVGVVAAVVPWNVPQFILMNKLAPALAAGCSVIVKPSPEAPLNALFLAELIDRAGIPEGVVSVLPAHREVSEYLVGHPGVDKVSFTGSTAAGRRIAALCGQQLKRVSLELGGKSAAIVLDDADLDEVAAALAFIGYGLSGQLCVAQTRVLASRERYADVVDALEAMVGGLVVGDPADPATQLGPLVAERQRERVSGYIELGQAEGARLVAGGTGAPVGRDQGWYVRPTLFADVDNGMRIAREEIFGPVLSVIPYDDEADAVRIANDSDYGLSGTVWSGDGARGLDVARQLRIGNAGVNRFAVDVRAPFGGFKASGLGRELGPQGLASFVEYQSVML